MWEERVGVGRGGEGKERQKRGSGVYGRGMGWMGTDKLGGNTTPENLKEMLSSLYHGAN